jgi:uncharacterized protein YjiS (DUF1127 family)
MDNRLLHEGLIGLERLDYDRRARRLRAEELARLRAWIAGALKALWSRCARALSASLQSLRMAGELRGLSDAVLKDIGLRRDQIDCVTRQIPC